MLCGQSELYVVWLAAVVQLVALEMNVATRHVEPQNAQFAVVRKTFPWLTDTTTFGGHRT
jgi:hypothetical protein